MTRDGTDVRRAGERFRTVTDGAESLHCFSFGQHYDAANTSFGPLTALNDETLEYGRVIVPHRHADVEIVTWPVTGCLAHHDSTGESWLTWPGTAGRLSAGTGVTHSVRAGPSVPEPSRSESPPPTSATAQPATRFISMWLTPDELGGEPSYAQAQIDAETLTSGLVVVASGSRRHRGGSALTLRRFGATLFATRLAVGRSVSLLPAEMVHLFVVSGAVQLDSGQVLDRGDSARMWSVHAPSVEGRAGAEILVWGFE